MAAKKCEQLAMFTVVCCLLIATVNGASTGTVQYGHLDLGTGIYNALKSHHNGSFAISPFGLGTLLTAISDEISTWRNYRKDETNCYGSLRYGALLGTNESLAKIMKNDFQGVKIYHTNKFYAAEDSIYATFMHVNEPIVPLDHAVVDFRDKAGAEDRMINDVRNSSEGLIQNPIPPGGTDTNTTVIFLTVLAFQGHFRTAYRKFISDDHFYKNGTSIGKIPFLHLWDQLKYVYLPEVRSTIVEIPYDEEGFSMIAILPDINTSVNQAAVKLNLSQVWDVLDNSEEQDVVLQLPQFTIESLFSLKDALMAAGLSEQIRCFPLTEDPLRGYQIQNDIRQVIYFEVKDAASKIEEHMYSTCQANRVIKFDRPFLITLRYKELSLMMAKITDPTQKKFS